jgi:ParB/RepB/Spo0J family partition protein
MSEIIKEIEMKKIQPSELNPRTEMNIEKLNELASSIAEIGLLEPIIVRPASDGYEVVVGERRYRASQQAGLEKIPAIVREYDDDEVILLNLIENIQREDLSAIEKGKVCKYLLQNCSTKYPSQTAIAKKIGVSNDVVSLWLRSLEVVPENAHKYVAASTASGQVPEGKIDYLTAVRVGRSIQEPEKRVEIIKKLAEKRIPTKERTEIIKRLMRDPESPIEKIINEVSESSCELEFLPADRNALVRGTKTQMSTTSIPDPKIKAGATVHAAIWEPHIAELRITSIERKRLKYFDEEDAKREGDYKLAEFRKMWSSIHGDWNEDQLVYVIHFEKTG